MGSKYSGVLTGAGRRYAGQAVIFATIDFSVNGDTLTITDAAQSVFNSDGLGQNAQLVAGDSPSILEIMVF